MAPPYHPAREKLDLDRRPNDEDPPLPARQYIGHEGQHEHPVAGTPSRVSPSSDLDGKGRPAPRRRIQVAVC